MLNEIFKFTVKLKSFWVLLLISLYPLLIFIAELTHSDFVSLSSTEKNSVSFAELLIAISDTELKFLLPIVLIGMMIGQNFNDDIKSGRLILFKDQNGDKIFNYKFLSILLLVIISRIILIISSIIVYLFFVNKHDYSSHSLFLNDTLVNKSFILSLVGIFSTIIILLFLGILSSIKFNSAYTIMIMVIGYILTKIVEMLPKFKVLPVSFIKLEHVQDFNFQLGMMIGLTLLYIIIFYVIARTLFKKLQY
ncbi:hypothetical protein ABH522_007045 [Staphylococcus pasteuri]|uniref:hypothetical protein n=1 Tax=Staphylococcus pasteuri TaxID=45972 RepID=UPI00325FE6C7